MLIPHIRSYFHPFIGKILFWNAVMLLFVKLILPQSAFQLASFLDTLPPFDSREIIKLTNEARALNKLPALSANLKLDLAAQDKLNHMATKEYFAHVSPDGVNPWYWIKNSGYNYTVAGENLAIGFLTAKEATEAWMNSPSHRANLLNNNYREIGVAVKGVEIEGREGILVVQMFGAQTTQVVANKPKVQQPKVSPAPTIPTPLTVANSQTKGESITLQQVTTDDTVAPVQSTIVRYENAENVKKVSDIINKSFSVYTLIVAALSVIAFFFLERSKGMVFKVAFNFAIFFISVIVPSSGIIFEGLIF